MTSGERPKANFASLEPSFFVSKYVKRFFWGKDPAGMRRKEHMWIKIEFVTSRGTPRGTLQNTPTLRMNVRHGDRVYCRLYQIEDVSSGELRGN